MGVTLTCMPLVIDDVGGSSPFREASLPLVLGPRPMVPVDPAFPRAFGLAELEVPFVDVNAVVADAFKSSCSFAVNQVDGVWTLTVQLRELRSWTRLLRGFMIDSLIAVDEGMSSLRSLSARSKASAEECAGRSTSDSSSQDRTYVSNSLFMITA